MRLTIVLLVVLSAACTDEPSARRALEVSGFTSIEMTGFKPFACSENDTFSTGFSAKGPTGMPVTGTVCAGLLKNSTIRID